MTCDVEKKSTKGERERAGARAKRDDVYRLKVDIAPELGADLTRVLKSQGSNLKEGMIRLIQFLVTQPEEMWPMILQQVRGQSAEDLAKALLKRVAAGERLGSRRFGKSIPPQEPPSDAPSNHG